MADPQAAILTQLKNIQTRTGKSIAELHAALAASGLAKHGEKRSCCGRQVRRRLRILGQKVRGGGNAGDYRRETAGSNRRA